MRAATRPSCSFLSAGWATADAAASSNRMGGQAFLHPRTTLLGHPNRGRRRAAKDVGPMESLTHQVALDALRGSITITVAAGGPGLEVDDLGRMPTTSRARSNASQGSARSELARGLRTLPGAGGSETDSVLRSRSSPPHASWPGSFGPSARCSNARPSGRSVCLPTRGR